MTLSDKKDRFIMVYFLTHNTARRTNDLQLYAVLWMNFTPIVSVKEAINQRDHTL